MIEHRSVIVNGLPFEYQVAGPADGDPLVLLPAQGDWAPLRDELARERRVYTPDVSSRGPAAREWPTVMRDEVLGLLDALGLDRVDLAGYRIGGEVAYLVAQAQPWRVARLVLEGVEPPGPHGLVRPEYSEMDWFTVVEGEPAPDELDRFRRITARTLVLSDGPTSHIWQDRIAEMARRIPDARLTPFPVGRPVHAAEPEEFVRAVVDFLGELPDSESARLWLAGRGVVRTGEDTWTDGESEEGRLTSNEVAHRWAAAALGDDSLDIEHRLRLGFGLVDLLDEYWVTVEIASAVQGIADPDTARVLWNGYRSRLDAPARCEAIVYSLWVDWFEDRDTAERVFTEVLGKDLTQLRPDSPEPMLRRARRVLESSGPVPWQAKELAYRIAARVPELSEAVFRGILHSHHDVYGDLDPAGALAVLDQMSLPEDTEHLAELRSALGSGRRP
ncbi:alpha/beta hydrolase [Streptomyces virginiae]|uniref:Alpha/beta hydrolase n=1 Tax=Streptomyces virginiae TaxID=1961 RepID=A0ABZ1T713_STRVG|nr:alpha/beta hydrolase [Streptomyces virginiae]WTB21300.1 alpha/beta hydrolase [Streptomyces virginiae]